MLVCCGLMAISSSRLTIFPLWCNINLTRDTTLKENYAKIIDKDLQKGYVITVSDSYMVEQRSDDVWYLAHHPVVDFNESGNVRRLLKGAAKLHYTPLNKSFLSGYD